MNSKRNWIIIGAVALAAVVIAVVALPKVIAARGAGTGANALKTGDVARITAITSVQSSGSISAVQQGSVFWKTTGTVAEVKVKLGDKVKAGDALMTLDPSSVPQNVIMAQSDLISAQKALDELLHPGALSIANAQKAVADAQDALDKAKQDLRSVENPAGKSLQTAVNDAKLALDTAQANLQLTSNNSDVQAYNNAVVATDAAFRAYQNAQAQYDASNGKTELLTFMQQMQAGYNNALANQQTYALRIQSDKANKVDAVNKAQDTYNTAVANLASAQRGPDANKLAIAKAKVAVTEATLADAQDKLNKLQNGADPSDIAAAQARVQAAQATVNSLAITAPFDGEVLAVNYQPGDSVSQAQAAVILANRAGYHVDVSVDETEVGGVTVGDTADLTFNSLPDMTLKGTVTAIEPLGQVVQGLVKYAVRVDLATSDPRVLLGMTADVQITTHVDEGALAVPFDAVQLDGAGEYVNRIKADGTMERVDVKSGEVQGEQVVVTGALQPGDKVQLVIPKPANSGGMPFGGG